MRSIRRILLIYDADGGALAGLVDVLRRFGSKRDACALRAITRVGRSERPRWAEHRARYAVPVVGVYRNELDSSMSAAAQEAFPCVIVDVDGRRLRVLDRTAIERCRAQEDPIACFETALRDALRHFDLSA